MMLLLHFVPNTLRSAAFLSVFLVLAVVLLIPFVHIVTRKEP